MVLRTPGARLFIIIFLASLGLGFLSGRYDGSAITPAAADGAGLSTPELINAARERGDIDEETAILYLAYAFVDYQALPTAYHSDVSWSGTESLRELQQQRPSLLPGLAADTIDRLLPGPCNPPPVNDPDHDILDTTHFHIQYVPPGNGMTINDYAVALERAWDQVSAFGWAPPPVLPSNPPPGNRYHIRVDPLSGGLRYYVSTDGGHAGLVGDNPATPWVENDAYATCITLDTLMGGTPQATLRSTAVRALNQAIQYGYGAVTGANAIEWAVSASSATWMEDEIYDGVNTNYDVLWPDFSSCLGEYTAVPPTAYWITWRGLTERYTSGVSGGAEQVMQDFWETVSQSASANLLPALDTALANQGTNLADAYHAYAVAAKFNKPCSGGYAYPYCFEEGPNYVAAAGPTAVHGTVATVGGAYSGAVADNYALNWVSLPVSGGPYDVTLRNNTSGGLLRGSLVCDTGAALNISPMPAIAVGNSGTTLTNYNPSGCTSVVAVITNQAQTSANPTSCTARNYQISVDPAAADLGNSSMSVAPTFASTGQTVTYTVQLVNNGSLSATASFTDILPAALLPVGTPTSTSGSPPAVNGQTVTWSGNVAAGQTVVLTFAAQLQVTAAIVNTAQLDDGAGNIYNLTAIVNGNQTYLPQIILR